MHSALVTQLGTVALAVPSVVLVVGVLVGLLEKHRRNRGDWDRY